MQHMCPKCGSQALGGRFCRQCGAPLFAETEATMAATRNYPAGQAPAAQTEPHYAQPTGPDYPAPDTARLYRPPASPPYPVPRPGNSNTALWVVGSILGLLVIIGIISAVVIPFSLARRKPVRVDPDIQIEIPRVPAHPPAPPLPPAPPGQDEVVAALERLKYPNATIDKKVMVAGTMSLKMHTSDDIEEVKKFYQDRFGPPTVERDDQDEIVFITPGTETTIIKLRADEPSPGQVQIEVVRTKAPWPFKR
jgi:hypothetical protein